MCVSRDSPRSTLSLYTLKVLIRGIPIACTAVADSHTPPEQGDPLKRIGLLRGNSLNRARNLQPRPATHSHSTTIALECTQHTVYCTTTLCHPTASCLLALGRASSPAAVARTKTAPQAATFHGRGGSCSQYGRFRNVRHPARRWREGGSLVSLQDPHLFGVARTRLTDVQVVRYALTTSRCAGTPERASAPRPPWDRTNNLRVARPTGREHKQRTLTDSATSKQHSSLAARAGSAAYFTSWRRAPCRPWAAPL